MSALVVEGCHGSLAAVRDRLADQGVAVTMAGSVADARWALGHHAYAVVIVDLVLPDGSGLDVLGDLSRSDAASHVIVLGASEADHDRALAQGADAFVVAPVVVGELVERVLAVRRQGDPRTDAELCIGSVTIDLRARTAEVDGRARDLTAKEFDLLAYLAARPGHTFSKQHVLRAVWGPTDEHSNEGTVTAHIRRLRAKIELNPARPQILRTVRGTGYRLAPPGHDDRTAGELGFATSTLIHVSGHIIQADQTIAALLGLDDEDDLLGRQIVDLAAPNSREATRRRVADVGPAVGHRTQLLDLEHRDGTVLSVEVASEEIDWKGQTAQRVSLTHVPDHSARLRRLVTGVLSELTDAVIITDLHFHLRSWNKAAERLYGWREEHVVGRHVFDILQWSGDGGELAATWDGLGTMGRWKGVSAQVTRDGSVIDVLACTTLVRDDDDEPVLIISVNRSAADLRTGPSPSSVDDEDIERGLANDEFEVYYQPVVALDDGVVVTMEALVRWNHPERGLLAPDSFIRAAERSGTIVQLGEVVLEKACIQTVEWQRAGHDIDLAVNLSARQLSDPGLVDRITAILDFSVLDPTRLWLEVTETSLVEEVDRASEVLHRLAAIGVGISIDDFGTGWASLTYLRTFPVDVLKIDRSFVAGVGTNANDTAIVRSILSLGAELGLFVVAEGIETAAQAKALRKLGCSIGQGFHYGQPNPASTAAISGARRFLEQTGPLVRSSRSGPPARRRVPTISSIPRFSSDDLLPRHD